MHLFILNLASFLSQHWPLPTVIVIVLAVLKPFQNSKYPLSTIKENKSLNETYTESMGKKLHCYTVFNKFQSVNPEKLFLVQNNISKYLCIFLN